MCAPLCLSVYERGVIRRQRTRLQSTGRVGTACAIRRNDWRNKLKDNTPASGEAAGNTEQESKLKAASELKRALDADVSYRFLMIC